MNKEKKQTNVRSWLVPVIGVILIITYIIWDIRASHRSSEEVSRRVYDGLNYSYSNGTYDVPSEERYVSLMRRRVRDSDMSSREKERANYDLDDYLEDYSHAARTKAKKYPNRVVWEDFR